MVNLDWKNQQKPQTQKEKEMLNKSLQQPDVIQQPLLNDENFLRDLVSTVCQQLLEAEISSYASSFTL